MRHAVAARHARLGTVHGQNRRGRPARAALVSLTLAAASVLSVGGGEAAFAVAGADLAVATTVSNPTPNVGDTVTVSVALSNAGPDTPATNVVANLQLPAGLTFVSSTPSQGSYNSATGVWTVGSVASGTPEVLSVNATVTTPSPVSVTAAITASDQSDPNPNNNAGTATISPQMADLAVSKTVDNAAPHVGATITYSVTVVDLGPNSATNVTVIDDLPAGLTFVSATPSQGSYNSSSGVWTIGTVSPVADVQLTIQATVNSSNALTNTAAISHTDQFDPDVANNAASATVIVVSFADLAVAQVVDNPAPTVGDPVTYTVTVTNHGPDAAPNVVVTDVLPAALTSPVYSLDGGATWMPAPGAWSIGTLVAGQSVNLKLRAVTTSSTPVTNTATVTSTQTDPNPANNAATVTLIPVVAPTPTPTPSATAAPTPVLDGPATTTAGSVITLSGSGFAPGDYSIVLHSAPVLLGTVTVGADGLLAASVTIPADTAAGQHTLLIQQGSTVVASHALAVTSASDPSAELASTGTNAVTGALSGLGALVLGGLMLAVARRRRRIHR
jgi:uncharacterized repeat protein (TIGR01451 family)/LPXTG-motif cell wall-anchored protein